MAHSLQLSLSVLFTDEPGLHVCKVAGDKGLDPVHGAPLVAEPLPSYQAGGTSTYDIIFRQEVQLSEWFSHNLWIHF